MQVRVADADRARIMLIHPEGNIANNPNLWGVVEILCNNGCPVDIYSPERPGTPQCTPHNLATLCTIPRQDHYVYPADFFFLLPPALIENPLQLQNFVAEELPRYALIIGVDLGIVEAALVAAQQGVLHALISYELYFADAVPLWQKKMEIEASRNLLFAIAQDELRAADLSYENKIPLERIIKIPVAGRGVKQISKNSRIHDYFSLPRDQKILLYMGEITAKWSGIGALLHSLHTWPDDWSLLIHHRYGCYPPDVHEVVARFPQNRLLVSPFGPLDFAELGELIQACDAGCAFYVPFYHKDYPTDGKNLEHIGLASGKIATYLQHGLPIVVNEIGEMSSHVRQFGLGWVVESVTDTGRVLADLHRLDLEQSSLNAQQFFAARLDLDKTITPLLSLVSGLRNSVRERVRLIPSVVDSKYLPTLSIVTPSYNQAAFLEECIDSVLSQGYPNLEYVIMDGGSTDGSVEIIKKYEKYLTYWQSRPDGGQYQAINKGFRHTRGEIMTWLNSDDKFHPLAFAKAASVFMTYAEVQWLTGRHNHWDTTGRLCWFDDHSQVLSRRKHLNGFFDRPFIQQEGTFWRRSLWQASGGGVATGLELAADLELWMRFFRLTRLYVVDTLLAGFRVHENQKSALHNKRYYAEAQGIIAEELSSFAGTLDALPPMPEPLRIDCRYVATLLHDGGCHHVAPLSAGIAWNNYLSDIKREAANLHDTRRFASLPLINQEVELLMLLRERALTAERLVLCKLAAAEKTGADLLQAGEQLLELGKLDAAELKFRQAHAVMPHSTHVHRDLARLYAVRGDQLQALEQYRQAVSAIPCNSSVIAETAEFLVQAGMVSLAGQLCQEHLNANPHDSVIAEVLQRIAGHAAAGRS